MWPGDLIRGILGPLKVSGVDGERANNLRSEVYVNFESCKKWSLSPGI